MGTAGYWILVVFGFGFLIFIHELGHFLAAKLVGIRVERFALGFGPRLFGKQVGATDYCVCLVPCGGYVKMAGGEGEQEATGAPDEFPSKTPGQRALVIAAGPVMSILVAVPILFGILMAGFARPSSRVHHVVPGMPAWSSPLKRGDVITGIRKQQESRWKEIRLWREVWLNSILKDKIGNIVLRVRRDGQELQFRIQTGDAGLLGIQPERVGRELGYAGNVVGAVPKSSSARAAGIVPGSRILKFGDRIVHTWRDVLAVAAEHPGEALPVHFVDPGGQRHTAMLAISSRTYRGLGIVARRSNRVELVRPGFPADRAGLRPGDAIVAVNDIPTRNWPQVVREVLRAPRQTVLTLVRTERASELLGELRAFRALRDFTADWPAAPLDEVPTTMAARVDLEPGEEIGDVLGVAPERHPVIEGFLGGSDAIRAGVPIGARLLEVSDPDSPSRRVPIRDLDDIHLKAWAAERLEVIFEHRGRLERARVTPVEGVQGVVDFSPRLDKCRVIPPGRPLAALRRAWVETARWVGFAAKALWMLVRGRIPLDMLSGPVMMVTASRFQAEVGFLTFLEFLVIITVHLGVINLVPFPILDGGHLAFLLIEKVRRKPLPEQVMASLLYAGMVFLIALMLFVTWNDISKLLGLG